MGVNVMGIGGKTAQDLEEVESLRERSGSFDSDDNLTSLFYMLMRDGYVSPGMLEKLISDEEKSPPEKLFTNGWLAKYAEDLSKRIQRKA